MGNEIAEVYKALREESEPKQEDKFEVKETVFAPFMVLEDEVRNSCSNCLEIRQPSNNKDVVMVCGIYKDTKAKFVNSGKTLEETEFDCRFWKSE